MIKKRLNHQGTKGTKKDKRRKIYSFVLTAIFAVAFFGVLVVKEVVL